MSDYTHSVIKLFPFGVRETRVAVGTTNLPWGAVESAEASETLITADLKGDDTIAAQHSLIEKITGTLKLGGVSLQAYALVTGRIVATTGVTPTRGSTLSLTAGDAFPYFRLYIRAVTDDGGDVWYVIYKAKISEGAKGTFAYGAFRETDISFVGVADSANSNKFMDIITHETASALPTT